MYQMVYDHHFSEPPEGGMDLVANRLVYFALDYPHKRLSRFDNCQLLTTIKRWFMKKLAVFNKSQVSNDR